MLTAMGAMDYVITAVGNDFSRTMWGMSTLSPCAHPYVTLQPALVGCQPISRSDR
ncbi:MAG: hypothetical protein R3E79_32235 [Caldilineaceae bacterium]